MKAFRFEVRPLDNEGHAHLYGRTPAMRAEVKVIHDNGGHYYAGTLEMDAVHWDLFRLVLRHAQEAKKGGATVPEVDIITHLEEGGAKP